MPVAAFDGASRDLPALKAMKPERFMPSSRGNIGGREAGSESGTMRPNYPMRKLLRSPNLTHAPAAAATIAAME